GRLSCPRRARGSAASRARTRRRPAGIVCSYKTPPGWHRVLARIGGGADVGAVFKSREATGEVWKGETRPDDLILTRVITLEGLEDGINRGPGSDSVERYIYFHGTNQ